MKLASGFCIPEPLTVQTGIKGRQVHPLIRFLLRSRVDEKCVDLHKPFIFYLFLVGITVQSADSLSAAITLGTFLKQIMDARVFFKMPFRPCPGCGRFLSADDRHDRCLQCLGFQHTEDAFVDDSCACCGCMSMTSLRSRFSFLKGLAPSDATRAGLSGSSRGPPAGALEDLRVTVRAFLPGTSPRTSYSSCSERPVRFPGHFARPSHGAPSISFGEPSEDRMSIAASGDGLTSSEDEGCGGAAPLGCCRHRHTGPRTDSHGCPGSREYWAGGQQTAQSQTLTAG